MHSVPIAPDGLALRDCRLFETSDLDDARERISGVMQPHRLSLRGRPVKPRAHMDFLSLCGLGIGTIAFGQAVIDVPPLDDYHLIIFCLSGSALLRSDQGDIPIDRFNGIACTARRPLAGEFSPDCEQFFVRIDRQRLAAFTGRADSRLAPRVDLAAPRLRPWLLALRTLVTDPATVRLVRTDPAVAADYEQLLLRLLLNGQEQDAPASHARPASVHRAIAYLQANFASDITLAELAAVAGVAERTLSEAFQRFEGVSPVRYLRNLRLDQARAALLARDATVTSAALGAGITHLSRFARDYRARFGERPSETISR